MGPTEKTSRHKKVFLYSGVSQIGILLETILLYYVLSIFSWLINVSKINHHLQETAEHKDAEVLALPKAL